MGSALSTDVARTIAFAWIVRHTQGRLRRKICRVFVLLLRSWFQRWSFERGRYLYVACYCTYGAGYSPAAYAAKDFQLDCGCIFCSRRNYVFSLLFFRESGRGGEGGQGDFDIPGFALRVSLKCRTTGFDVDQSSPVLLFIGGFPSTTETRLFGVPETILGYLSFYWSRNHCFGVT